MSYMLKRPLAFQTSLGECNQTVSKKKKKNDVTTFPPGDRIVDRNDLLPVLYGSLFQFLILSSENLKMTHYSCYFHIQT